MSAKKQMVIKEIEEVEGEVDREDVPDLVSDDEEEAEFDPEDFDGRESDDSEEEDEDDESDDEAEEDTDLGSLFQYFFTNDNGENVADILTGLKDSIDTHNKLIFKLLQKVAK